MGPPRYFASELPSLGGTFQRSQLAELSKHPNSTASVTLGDETRRAFATTLPSAITFPVDVPPEPRLQLGIALATLDAKSWAPIQFRVLVDTPEGRTVVFSESIQRPERNQWLSRDIDLSRFSGTTLRLTLQARRQPSTDGTPSTEALIPLWANPVLSGASCCSDKPNVVLISIDCLRADHVGAYGYERETTPHIDAFSKEGVLFETAVSTAPMTPPSHMSMFTGLFPSLHDGSKWAKVPLTVPYLPEVLSRAGYQTDAIVTGPYLSHTFGFERGFDSYRLDYPAPAAEAVDRAIELLRQAGGRNQFLFVHLFDVHWPYEPPAELIDRFGPAPANLQGLLRKMVDQEPPSSPQEVDQVVALYDAELTSADAELGRFLEHLKSAGLYQRSLIIVTADHGESFYGHGHWQHSLTLYEELIRIPSIVKWPGDSPKGHVRSQVSQVDIYPTVLKAAGLEPSPTNGIDLREFVEGTAEARKRRWVVSETAWRSPAGWARKIAFRTEKLKYIATLAAPPGVEPQESHLEREELYDLLGDPEEKVNLLEASSVDVESFRRELAQYLSEARSLRTSRQTEHVVEDDVTLERLRSLGYIN